MNREFKPTSTLIRVLLATASVLVSGMVVVSMASLAEHYNAESPLAGAVHAVVAQH